MDAIALKIIDPAGQPWAQLVDPGHTVGEALPVIARRLALPGNLHYQLWPDGLETPLAEEVTFADANIAPGATLLINPVEDGTYSAFARRLYSEAAALAREQSWDEVRARLDALFAVAPDHPDPLMLRAKAEMPRPTPPPPPPADEAQEAEESPAPPPQPARRRDAGTSPFVWLFFLVAGAAVAAGVLVYLRVVPAPDWLPDWFPQQAMAATTVVNGVTVGTGDVRVTLTWSTRADLNRHVTDPAGAEISAATPQSPSGGRLDVSANGACSDDLRVENVFWPSGSAPSGTYSVTVRQADDCGIAATPFEVAAYAGNTLVYRLTGTLSTANPEATLPNFARR